MTSSQAFRHAFKMPRNMQKWFPGHMNRGLRDMQRLTKHTDCFIEIHDARIPFSGRNVYFQDTLTASKPRILVLNKVDLVDLSTSERDTVEQRLRARRDVNDIVWTSSIQTFDREGGLQHLVNRSIKLIQDTERSATRIDVPEYTCMIIGIPNVGKSSIINSLRRIHLGRGGNVARVGSLAGFTKAVHERIRISVTPPVFLLDTPGIMEPQYGKNLEEMIRVGLCGCLNDEVIDIHVVADYLLFMLNRKKNFSYVHTLGLSEPCDNINELLVQFCINRSFLEKKRQIDNSFKVLPDLSRAAKIFVKGFRTGEYGHLFLDDDFIS